MAINRAVITATPISQNTQITIEMLLAQPVLGVALDVAVSPNTMYGWYNPTIDKVELYISDINGLRWLRVG